MAHQKSNDRNSAKQREVHTMQEVIAAAFWVAVISVPFVIGLLLGHVAEMFSDRHDRERR
jgi:hypothetical protein